MKLNLKRPLAFFDLEATGTNVGADRIVEIAVLKAMPNGDEIVKTWRVNPQMPIPLVTSLIHGIYDEDIANEPTFNDLASEISTFIGDADLAGYNSNKFDIPMLLEEFLRAGVEFDMNDRKFVDVQNIFHQMEQRTLKAAYKFYCNEDLVNAHAAEADVIATYKVLLSQLDKYEGVEFEDKKGNISTPVVNDVDALHIFTNVNRSVDFAGRLVFNDQDEVCFNFGKHKGKTTKEVFSIEPSYYAWMKNGDFPLFTKQKLDEEWAKFNANKKENNLSKSFSEPKKKYIPKPQQKDTKPAKPVDNDMLEQLKLKFGK